MFEKRLMYVRDNKHEAKLFSDPQNHIMIKMEDIPSLLESKVWVDFPSD